MIRRSQIRMGESIIVMFIFLIFVVIGFSFYAKLQNAGYSKEKEKQYNLLGIETAQKVSFLPELQCPKGKDATETCIDLMKAEAFENLLKEEPDLKNGRYFDMFGYSTIILEEVYPSSRRITIYNNTLEDSSSIFTPVPISIYNPKDKRTYFGVIRVRYYPVGS